MKPKPTAPAIVRGETEPGGDAGAVPARAPAPETAPECEPCDSQPQSKPALKKKRISAGVGIFLAALMFAVTLPMANMWLGGEYWPIRVDRLKTLSQSELDYFVQVTNLRLLRDTAIGNAHGVCTDYVDLARCSMKLGNVEHAEACLLKALALANTNTQMDSGGLSEAAYSLMELYTARGDTTKAGAYAGQWLTYQRWELNPNSVGRYLFCAHVCRNAGRLDEARQAEDLARRSSLRDGSYVCNQPPAPNQFDEEGPLQSMYGDASLALSLGRNDAAVRYLRFIVEQPVRNSKSKTMASLRTQALMMLPVAEFANGEFEESEGHVPVALASYRKFYAGLDPHQDLALRNAALGRERHLLYRTCADLCKRKGDKAGAEKWQALAEAGMEQELHPELWTPWWR